MGIAFELFLRVCDLAVFPVCIALLTWYFSCALFHREIICQRNHVLPLAEDERVNPLILVVHREMCFISCTTSRLYSFLLLCYAAMLPQRPLKPRFLEFLLMPNVAYAHPCVLGPI